MFNKLNIGIYQSENKYRKRAYYILFLYLFSTFSYINTILNTSLNQGCKEKWNLQKSLS